MAFCKREGQTPIAIDSNRPAPFDSLHILQRFKNYYNYLFNQISLISKDALIYWCFVQKRNCSSLPRRRKSTAALLMAMDSRLRGNEDFLSFFLHEE